MRATDPEAGFAEQRRDMVVEQLAKRGIKDERVLAAMALVPRHRFVDAALADLAYDDRPLPIGFGQTISQPYMVARATELCTPKPMDRALEIGAGCGYQVAVLAQVCAWVYGIEVISQLAEVATNNLRELGVTNAEIQSFDGSSGWPAHAPYDVIVVSAGAPRVPPMLVDQLADGGRMVVPVGEHEEQELVLIRRDGDRYVTSHDTRCRYVDLVGRYGFGRTPPIA